MQSSSAPRSSVSATLTSPNTNTSQLKTEIVLIVLLVVSFLVFVLVVWCVCRKKRKRPGRYHRDAPHARQDDFDGRTPQYHTYFTDVKTITVWGNSDVNINPSPSNPFNLGNAPELPPPLLPVSMPRPPTAQALPDSGLDLSSGLQGSRQPIPPPPPVSVPRPPTSQAVLDSEDDISSGFGALQRPLPPPPVSVPRPPTSQAVLDSADDISSGFGALQRPLPPPPPPGMSFGSLTKFSYEELEEATDNFSQTNLLGEGGFADVYKGTLPGRKNIAVKRLKVRGREGERDFQEEMEIISRVHHRHLVSFLGYCIADDQRLLVYEFVPNNTLKHHLHGEGQPSMEWPTRLKIANEVARGLAYLHEDCSPKIIHRDIKPANILLDSNFEAKIADFGLAKLVSEGSPWVPSRVRGTHGYLGPECLSPELTDKSDVFAFGVVLLELITGREPLDLTLSFPESTLFYWARPLLARAMEDGNLDTIIDARLQNNYNVNEMMRVVACAASCVKDSETSRPCMKMIVRVLEGDVSPDNLQQGVPEIQAGA